MKEHTPEPWRMHTRAVAYITSEDHGVADCSCWDDSTQDTMHEKEANARRIVAAINACAGIPTEDLEDAAGEETQWQRLELLAEDAKWYANKEDQT